jgi:N-formylmaleamate deformylase
MTDWQARAVRANGIRIHYYRTGGDKPPLVLAHGLSDDALCWRRVVNALAPSYDVVFYDMRGHGLSEAPPAGYTPADRASDLVGLVETLGLDRVRLLGHSLGAETASWVAANHAELVDRVALEDPPWRGDWVDAAPEERAQMAESWRTNLAEHKTHRLEELVEICRARSPHWDEEDLMGWAEGKVAVDLRAVANVSAARPPWQEIVSRIACPTLLITGDPARGALVTPEVAREAARINQRIEILNLADAGHSVRRDRFAEYVAGVRAFLARNRLADGTDICPPDTCLA